MALTQKSVGITIAVILIALAGLVVVQVALLKSARDLEAQTFRTGVQAALAKTVHGLETVEVATMAVMVAGEASDSLNIQVVAGGIDRRHLVKWERQKSDVSALFSDSTVPTAKWCGDTVVYLLPAPHRVLISSPFGGTDQQRTILDTSLAEGEHRIRISADKESHQEFVYRFIGGDSISAVRRDYRVFDSTGEHGTIAMDIEARDVADSSKFAFVEEIVSRLTLTEDRPIAERVNVERLDSLLLTSLAESGISLGFKYGVVSQPDDQFVLSSDRAFQNQLASSEYRAGLFPLDFGPSPAELVVHFPDRELFLWRQIWPIGLATMSLMLVIVVVFAYTTRTIINQRRNAALMVDFVNNMTHEFKTPISTVALASEAILRDDVIGDPERVAKFGKMISSENRRMRLQAEKILQMAALEEKDHRLKLEPIDCHSVISEAVENVSLRIESHQGRITADLRANSSIVAADPIHLMGIINNLLDNAIKYSEESPVIELSTAVIGRHLVIKIGDQGMGLRLEDRKRVFDKYYRVSSGNVHNVKGFGLGLSYVQLMVKAHGGDIEVDSTFGRGTTFTIRLPLVSDTQTEVTDGLQSSSG